MGVGGVEGDARNAMCASRTVELMEKRFILQGITTETHRFAMKHVLEIPDPLEITLSTAFITRGGLVQIRSSLAPVAEVTTIIAGIRNGITSEQGLLAALEIGCKTIAVDSGSRNVIFHPKIYFARNATSARIVIGSANLTMGGLNSNIEASVMMTLDLRESGDAAFVADIQEKISGMQTEYPEHVFIVPDAAAVDLLLEAGRVVDESIATAPTPSGSSSNRDLDTIARMRLKTPPIRRRTIPVADEALASAVTTAPMEAPVMPTAAVRPQLTLVWESKPLRRRNLDIPIGPNTNRTGSTTLGKGVMKNIDQRHYFRDYLFSSLEWLRDSRPERSHIERADIRCQIVIRDVYYGEYCLSLSHNTLTDTATYDQRNSPTELHWGVMRPLIAREDLLKRTLYIYRDESRPDLFVLEID